MAARYACQGEGDPRSTLAIAGCTLFRQVSIGNIIVAVFTNVFKSGMTVDDIQYLCNILGDFPELLVQFAFFLPPDRRFTLSPDFEQTRLVLIRQGAKNVRRRASFGLIDGHIDGEQAQSACVHVCHLLNSVFQEEDREEAVLTLRGGDAQCAISHIQQVRYCAYVRPAESHAVAACRS